MPNEGYAVCWDTSDNGTCDSAWWPNGAATARVLEGLSAGTYYWQVRTAGGGVLADNGAWHAFTVATAALFSKQAPANGAGGLGSTVTLQWTRGAGGGLRRLLGHERQRHAVTARGGRTEAGRCGCWKASRPGTYYWQVRTAGGAVLADNGAWHAFTVATAALFSKQAPGNGATGLGSTVTLQWTAVPEEGYAVCWDTSDNGSV